MTSSSPLYKLNPSHPNPNPNPNPNPKTKLSLKPKLKKSEKMNPSGVWEGIVPQNATPQSLDSSPQR
jgi:hypothetical protein